MNHAGILAFAMSVNNFSNHSIASSAEGGAKTPAQARANAATSNLPGLSADQMAAARDVYDRLIAPHVAHLW